MLVEHAGYTFRKGIDSSTVNVYFGFDEVDVFTNYGIRRSWNKLQKAAETYVNERE